MSANNEKRYTVSLYSENHTGLVGRIAQIFTRRKINIDSLTTSESEIKGIFRFTIVIHVSENQVIKVVNQLKKIIDETILLSIRESKICKNIFYL